LLYSNNCHAEACVLAIPQWSSFIALALPIGISFYVFHGISLIVDKWRNWEHIKNQDPLITHAVKASLYLSFFPQLVAGPIILSRDFYPQLISKRFQDIPWLIACRNIIVGLFLKRVIADNLNELTLPLTNPSSYTSISQIELIAMIFGYSAQIFADFAGYSLIAIGVAKIFGINLPINFNRPYAAQSISEFWRRWHISLSTWLREYLYIPLGGNKAGLIRIYLNLLIVMALGGIWHGAAWKFAVWGLFHGVLLVIERLLGFNRESKGWLSYLRILNTFLLVTFGWLLFRLENFGDLLLLKNALLAPYKNILETKTGLPHSYLILFFSLIVVIFNISWSKIKLSPSTLITLKKSEPYLLGALFAIVLIASGNQHAFIYFQF